MEAQFEQMNIAEQEQEQHQVEVQEQAQTSLVLRVDEQIRSDFNEMYNKLDNEGDINPASIIEQEGLDVYRFNKFAVRKRRERLMKIAGEEDAVKLQLCNLWVKLAKLRSEHAVLNAFVEKDRALMREDREGSRKMREIRLANSNAARESRKRRLESINERHSRKFSRVDIEEQQY